MNTLYFTQLLLIDYLFCENTMDKIINFENKKEVFRILCIKIIDFLPFCMLETKSINIEIKNVYCTYIFIC